MLSANKTSSRTYKNVIQLETDKNNNIKWREHNRNLRFQLDRNCTELYSTFKSNKNLLFLFCFVYLVFINCNVSFCNVFLFPELDQWTCSSFFHVFSFSFFRFHSLAHEFSLSLFLSFSFCWPAKIWTHKYDQW